MNRPFEFSTNRELSVMFLTTSGKVSCKRRNKAKKFVYNKIQQFITSQPMLSSGEDHPADGQVLSVIKVSFASDYGRYMRPLIVGWNRGGYRGLSVTYRMYFSQVKYFSLKKILNNKQLDERQIRIRQLINNHSYVNQSTYCYYSIRLVGERPDNSGNQIKKHEKSHCKESTSGTTKPPPIIRNIVRLSVTGKNFTCGISLF